MEEEIKPENIKEICIIIDAWFPLQGGGQVYVKEVSRILAERHEVRVDILTRNISGDILNQDIINDTRVNVKMFGPEAEFDNVFSRVFFLFQSILYLLFKKSYDLYAPQSILPGIVGKVVSVIKRRPVVLTVHGSLLSTHGDKGGIKSMIERIILTKIKYTKVISVSRAFTKLENNNKDIVVIPNGVDVNKFDDLKVEKYIYPTLLFVGRFDRIKGLKYLIRAIKRVKEEFNEVRLNLVGYGFEEKELKSLVDRERAKETIFFKGKIVGVDLIKEYKKSWVYVLPSLSEGHPLTILEAWAARLPVIATNVGDNPEYIKDSINGYLVTPKDIDELSATIIKVLKNDSLRDLGESGYKNVASTFSWERTADSTIDVYNKSRNNYE